MLHGTRCMVHDENFASRSLSEEGSACWDGGLSGALHPAPRNNKEPLPRLFYIIIISSIHINRTVYPRKGSGREYPYPFFHRHAVSDQVGLAETPSVMRLYCLIRSYLFLVLYSVSFSQCKTKEIFRPIKIQQFLI